MRDSHMSLRKYVPIILNSEGYRGFYKGFYANFLRDVPGWAFYFYTFELFKEWCHYFANSFYGINPAHKQRRDLIVSAMAGGSAGVVSWLVSYPMDVIKTHI